MKGTFYWAVFSFLSLLGVFPYREAQFLYFLPGLTRVLTAGATVDVYHDNGTDFISLSYAAHSAAYVKQQTEIDVIILDFMSWLKTEDQRRRRRQIHWAGRVSFFFVTTSSSTLLFLISPKLFFFKFISVFTKGF